MVVIIPARAASSRLADKVLLDFGGVPMVIKTAQQARGIARTVIATDDERVMAAAREHGYEAVMTASSHSSGSERLAEAAQILDLADSELVVNLQADEPFFGAENLAAFCEFASEHAGEYFMASAFYKASEPGDENRVKVVCDLQNYALYFSRSAVPYYREGAGGYCHHIGIYAYSVAALREFVQLSSRLENYEKLEQLRALENGKKILMCELADVGSFGIDSPQDYERALKLL